MLARAAFSVRDREIRRTCSPRSRSRPFRRSTRPVQARRHPARGQANDTELELDRLSRAWRDLDARGRRVAGHAAVDRVAAPDLPEAGRPRPARAPALSRRVSTRRNPFADQVHGTRARCGQRDATETDQRPGRQEMRLGPGPRAWRLVLALAAESASRGAVGTGRPRSARTAAGTFARVEFELTSAPLQRLVAAPSSPLTALRRQAPPCAPLPSRICFAPTLFFGQLGSAPSRCRRGRRTERGRATASAARAIRTDVPRPRAAGRGRGARRRPRSRRGRAACASGGPAGAGTARRRPRACPAPRTTATASVESPTGPPPNFSQIGPQDLAVEPVEPDASTSSMSSASARHAASMRPSPRTSAKSRTRFSSRFATRGVPRERRGDRLGPLVVDLDAEDAGRAARRSGRGPPGRRARAGA